LRLAEEVPEPERQAPLALVLRQELAPRRVSAARQLVSVRPQGLRALLRTVLGEMREPRSAGAEYLVVRRLKSSRRT
jgi:hypothetical protein